MRPLTDEEKKAVFEKLAKFIGEDLKVLVDRKDEPHVFRLHRNRIYYMSQSILNYSSNFGRKELLSAGTLLGKMTTKSGKFRLTIQSLDLLAAYAKNKVWVKANNEMSILYGNNVLKSGVAKMTENMKQHAGVVIFNMNDVPLGFGVSAHTTDMCRTLEPTAIVVLHQADIGEYLRNELEMA